MSPRIVIVGASLGGAHSVTTLRARGFDGDITVVGDEPHMPYNRPPLSKRFLLNGGEVDSLLVRGGDALHSARWVLNRAVKTCDLRERSVELDDGSVLPYDGLVVATGVRPRRLPLSGARTRRHVVRTASDAQALRSQLTAGARVIIIGAGFIGCEVAAAALMKECKVDIVAIDEAPMIGPLGPMLGEELRSRHEQAGVRFHLGNGVVAVDDDGTVDLDSGERLRGDVIVEAMGTIPNVEWLDGNDLDLSNGVLCDEQLRTIGAENVVAVGDVARFPHGLSPDPQARRIEHSHIPADTAATAAPALLRALGVGTPEPDSLSVVPTFTSLQGRIGIRSFGFPGLATETDIVEGELGGDVAIGWRHDGALVGITLLGMARESSRYLELVTSALTGRFA